MTLKTLRHLTEYILLRAVVLWVDWTPLPLSRWLVARLADCAFALDRGRRRVAIDNILHAGIETDPARATRLARMSARHFVISLVETLKAGHLLADPDRVVLLIAPSAQAVLDNDRSGLLLAGGHFGNWELGAQALSRLKPVVAAARRVSNPYVDRFLLRRKPNRDFRLVLEWFGSPTRYTEALAGGEVLALLIDLDARGEGLKIDFFGRPAATHITVAMLHLVTKAPLAFGSCRRMPDGRFEVTISELIEHRPTGDKEADVRAIMSRLNAELETAIRAAPEQYLWAHSRWKYGSWEPPPGFVPVSGRLGGTG